MKPASEVPQYATDFVFFTREKVFSVASPDNRQNNVSGRLRELKKKLSIFFSAGTEENAKLLQKFSQFATDFVLPIVR